jgi:hypothetical protein
VAALSLLCLLSGYSDYGITWDEADPNFPAARNQAAWFHTFISTGQGLTEEGVRAGFETASDHPSLPRTWMALSRVLLPESIGDRIAFALPTAVAVALFLGVFAEVLRRRLGLLAALAGTGILLFHPRFFAHAHFAAYDMPIVLAWWLAAMSFYWANFREAESGVLWRRNTVAAFFFALAMSIKLHAFFIPFPLLAWVLLFRRWSAWRWALLAALLAPSMYLATQPYLWWDTWGRLSGRFLDYAEKVPISVYYFGRLYEGDLPWHYPWAMLVATLPVGFGFLVLLGMLSLIPPKDESRATPEWTLSWGVFVVLNLLTTPLLFSWKSPYDGIRLFLTAVPFLAMLAAGGAALAAGRLQARGPAGKGAAWAIAAVLVLGQAWTCYRFHPNGLSHYSLFIGGIRGAREFGMETTYWCDGLTRDFVARLDEKFPTGGRLRAHALDAVLFEEYRRLGWLKGDWTFNPEGPVDARAIQYRQGFFGPPEAGTLEWRLSTSDRPILVEREIEAVPLARVYAGP